MTPSEQVLDIRMRLDSSLDQYRILLHDCLDGLTEEEAPTITRSVQDHLLGLVKHVTYVEKFYFEHCVTGRPLKQIGVATTPDRSFVLTKKDTIESIRDAHRKACEESREVAAKLKLDDIVTGRVDQAVLTIYLRTLHDLISHCGHADILRGRSSKRDNFTATLVAWQTLGHRSSCQPPPRSSAVNLLEEPSRGRRNHRLAG
jgi:hypothetical protein